MKIKLFILSFPILFTLYSLLFTLPVYAARKRVRKAKPQAVYVSRGVKSSVRLRPDRLGLFLTFSSFDNLASGRYELIYDSNGITQGAGGSILIGDTGTKELVFGTASGGVFNYHTNISNARLSIVSVLKDGTTVLKPYRIKI